MIPPCSTYRLQLNRDFTLGDAAALVPFLDDLGVSHAYLSPILKAQPGSTHGYDTVDHGVINPEIGTIEDFRALSRALRVRNMGIVLDFVPNHMGVGGADNALWLDVLRHGPSSRYAGWFDIDWRGKRRGAGGRVLLPFLGKPYAQVLSDGDIALKADGEGFAVWAYDKDKLPVRPQDAAALLGQHGSAAAAVAAHAEPQALDRLIARQHWRLAHFSTAGDEINYRRFFINSELAGILIDRADVFDHAHRRIFALIEEGLIDGLRIDHIDGLLDPPGYLRMLRAKSPRPIYLTVEKILAPHEYLRADWPVDGTTGYEAGAQLTRVLTHGSGEKALTQAYDGFVGPNMSPRDEAFQCKLRVMDNELASELDTLSQAAAGLAWSVAQTADLTAGALKRALREIIAHMDVYRIYGNREGLAARDRRELLLALARARRSQPQIQPVVYRFLEALLGGTLGGAYSAGAGMAVMGKFQQLSGPVMAKGLEDTALYRYNRLVSLNEVGAHPDRFNLSISAFHDSNKRRRARHPDSMIATSTHDTKRGEDIRMIISSIADAPGRWIEAVQQWRGLLGGISRDIHPNDLYLFFQLLTGGWPITGSGEDFAARLRGAMRKSLREARQRSDWGVNNDRYERAIEAFIDAALGHRDFMESFHAARGFFVAIGQRKALIQTVLKLTIPGVPDIYRGAEDWEQSFVDPDNRRPIDFGALARRLADPAGRADAKLHLTRTLLHLRRRHPALFSRGSYEPIEAQAEVLAFRRRHEGQVLHVFADLTQGHEAGFAQLEMSGETVTGSRDGPIWVIIAQTPGP